MRRCPLWVELGRLETRRGTAVIGHLGHCSSDRRRSVDWRESGRSAWPAWTTVAPNRTLVRLEFGTGATDFPSPHLPTRARRAEAMCCMTRAREAKLVPIRCISDG